MQNALHALWQVSLSLSPRVHPLPFISSKLFHISRHRYHHSSSSDQRKLRSQLRLDQSMAEHQQQQQLIHHQRPAADTRTVQELFQKGPTKSQVIAVVTLFPVGAVLLLLAGLTLTGTLLGLAVTAPLFVLFSPILVPAALLIAFAITGFLTSGAFGITALSAISWIVNFLRGVRVGSLTQPVDYAKQRTQEAAGFVGQRAKEFGETIQSKAHEEGRPHHHEGGGRHHEGGRAREGAKTTTATTTTTT